MAGWGISEAGTPAGPLHPRLHRSPLLQAVFVNEWDAGTRTNYPLDVTPYLDDVTILYQEPGGPKILSYEMGEED